MDFNFRVASVLLVLLLGSGSAVAENTAVDDGQTERRWSQMGENLPENAWDAHVGWVTLPVHLAGIAMTPLWMESGLDRQIQNGASHHDETLSIAWSVPGLLLGFLTPIALPAGMMGWADDPVHIRGGAAAAQSGLVAFTSNLILKSITNRKSPENGVAATESDVHGFRFGWWRQVPFDGWPSGHVMTNSAMASALAVYYQDPWVTTAAIGWTSYMMAVVSIGGSGGVHWTSDAVTGLVMGTTIGTSIGLRFRGDPDHETRVQFLPFQAPGGGGLTVYGGW